MTGHSSTGARAGIGGQAADQRVVMWPTSETTAEPGWHGLGSSLATSDLDWSAAAQGLVSGATRTTLSQVIGRLLESTSLSEFLAATLKVCDCLVTADATGFDLLHPVTGHPLQVTGVGVSTAFLSTYEGAVRTRDTVLHAAITSRRAQQCTDLFTPVEWQGTSAYREAFGLLQLAHVLYVPLVIEEHVVGTLNFGRTEVFGRYSEDEVELLEELSTVLALIVAQELSRSEMSEDHLPDPVQSLAVSGLSQREVTIARLVARGLHDQEIADQLGLSLHTIKQYLKQIYRKTSLRSRVDLAVDMVTYDAIPRPQDRVHGSHRSDRQPATFRRPPANTVSLATPPPH